MDPVIDTGSTAEGRYTALQKDRSPYIQRAEECAKLTLPMLAPKETITKSAKIKTPFQGIGARGVNNLASKLLLALLPPQAPFFRLMVDELVLKKSQNDDLKTKIEESLAEIERNVMTEIETSADRVAIFEALKHIIISGNVLIYVGKNGMRVFPLSRFVIVRDPEGNPLEIVVHEEVAPETLEKAFLKKLEARDDYKRRTQNGKWLNIYTHIKRETGKWVVYQEVMGEEVPGTRGTHPLDASPWIPLRFNRIDGEDYGRGYVEEYLGDLKSLETLTQAIVEGAAAAAKVLLLVNPNGTTRAKTIAEAPNGAVREGNAEDVSVLQLQKYSDFRTAYQAMERIEQRLEYAFLLNTAIQRNGERVTAEEVRYMAGELEDALGGVYSILSQEFQLPYVRRRMNMLVRDGKLPELPKDIVKPSIVTGLEALGRGHDRNKLVQFVGTLAQLGGPEAMQRYVNVGELIARLAISDGIDPKGLIKSQEQIEQEMQQQQMAAMAERVGPDVVRQAGAMMQQPQGEANGPQSPQGG